MEYIISFIEGIITFISPCLLPMLPIYVSYFAGGGERNTRKTLQNALGFVMGFTIIFVLLGALAGSLGAILARHRIAVNIVTGVLVIFFGLYFLGVFKITLFKGMKNPMAGRELGFFSSMLFGAIFSIGWTPCVGAFLGSALALASQQGSALKGILMLLCYSVGLGIPFVISAVLIDQLKSAFSFIKRHYKVINIVCGSLLILLGVLMMTGLLSRFMTMLG
jgi:cytochrome c-type biogenesis protein